MLDLNNNDLTTKNSFMDKNKGGIIHQNIMPVQVSGDSVEVTDNTKIEFNIL